MTAPIRDIHDASFKLLFGHERAVADLLTGFVRQLLGAAFDYARLDLDSLEPRSTEYVDDKLRQSRGDCVWRMRYRAADGAPSWVYLLVMLEFQSSVDRDMAARVSAYTAQLYLQIRRDDRGDRHEGPLPPVLPVVIYNGWPRWSAARDIRDAIAPAGAALEQFQLRQRYLLLDVHRMQPENLPEDNVVSARFALEHGDPEAVPAVVAGLRRLLAGPEHASLRRAFGATLRHMLAGKRFGASDAELDRVGDLEDLGAMGTMFEERLDGLLARRAAESEARGVALGEARGLERGEARGVALGEARGLERGEARGVALGEARGLERGEARGRERERALGRERERTLLARLANRKFGPDAASRLAAAVAGVDDPDRLDEVGEEVILCANSAEFLARVEEIARRR